MRSATLWQFTLALLVLWLVMEYIPYGVFIGAFVLALALLETPQGVDAFAGLLHFVQTGQSSPATQVLTLGG